ncbi:cytochrome d ubiquinol oxidase subunit II [Enterobacteriaceae endosymbiont of Neohaemonia nigricornis]|uniref:cytochrome d ubiquinol oxidase subunit II n=1 Tax=Enterobacteriaceae endosymbiont of Neohaemonia nigricornis TaxID=2675792 RepID=UPI0014498C6D|nr:cytochrome d ubiquinol oxidase subunit II [Enterobacteriaceae endosymbiont of Neohaemonia nigricornis]QJC30397.1 cytochrome d ubiquinol oxidase subunit II [Enterobacteriaceae endosymbiont of Neohaemonia nigricornis]
MFNYDFLRLTWYILIIILITGFIITDGLDMGVGILLFIIGRHKSERKIIINTIAPHWDGNQVWLITTAGAIFAAWPNVYATLFSSFYIIIFILLFALFLRPIGFEYRSKLSNILWEKICDIFISIGSLIPPISLGIILGCILQGIPYYFDRYYHIYSNYDVLTLFSSFNIIIIITLTLLMLNQASNYLQIRINNKNINNKLSIIIPIISILLLFFSIISFINIIFYIKGYKLNNIISIYTMHKLPMLISDIIYGYGMWINNFLYYPQLFIIPILGILSIICTILFSIYNKDICAFICSIFYTISAISTIAMTTFPFIIPNSNYINHTLTAWNATSSQLTLNIMLYTALIFVPIIVLYTFWCYKQMFYKITIEQINKNPNNFY